MADYTDSKPGVGAVVPDNATEVVWDQVEPLITPAQLRALHLFGIPLVSGIRNPVTGKPDVLTDPQLKEYIKQAAGLVELEGGFQVFPKQFSERHAYDQKAQDSFGYTVLRQRPAVSVEELAVVSSDGVNVWDVPLAWIETGYLHSGQINLVPFAVASQAGVTIPITSPVGMGLLPSLFRFNWVPALWRVKYTAGFKDGQIPLSVNQLVGVVAAMEVLSQLATTFARSQSASLGIDGLSQSVSTPGPNLYAQRMTELAQKRKWLIKKLQRTFGLGLFADNV